MGSRPGGGPSRSEVLSRLERDGLLPAITFIFSRAGCEAAVAQLLADDVRLVEEAEGERIRRLVEERVSALADEDLGVIGYWDFVEGLTRGFAPTTRGCCRRSVRSSRSSSPRGGCGRSSPPRPWRWGSTCPRGPSSSSGW